MEEQIKHIAKSQRIVYVIFWAVAILLVVGGETELLPVGLFADDVRTSYYLETIGILLTAINIPFSMKLFSLVLTRKIDNLTFPVALSRYAVWSHIRLGLVAIVVVYNLLCYYMTLNSTGALCALCALTASFFCLPIQKRLRNELHINKEE